MKEIQLGEICGYRIESVPVDPSRYISTETMMPNRGEAIFSSSAPAGGKARRFCKGDTLVSNIRPYFKKIWQADCDGCCSNDILVFEPRACLPDYLYWLLSGDSFFDYVVATSKGTKMPRGDKNAIMDYRAVDFDQETQLSISRILNPMRKLIATNRRINDYLAETIEALFKHEILEAIDDSWSRASLLDIADYKNGLAMQKFRPKGTDPGLPVLKIKELGQGQCAADAERCRSDIDESVQVHDGDLIFSWSGTLLLDFWAGGNAGLNQHLFKVSSEKYSPWFYYLWTNYHMRKFIALAKDRATTMGHIKRSALAESEVYIPNASRMLELGRLFDPLIERLVSSKIESKKLSELRDVLLPKLMSGEIDVGMVEISG